MMASVALEQFTSREDAVLFAVTQGACKAVWPTLLKELIAALFFFAVLRQECWQGQAFLELDFVFRHDVTFTWAENQCRQFSL